jgi:EAL domain-containing protein (putative c-di-GMP-specific phosphodiesterase class I)/GGDEF domain-containing protein
MSRVTPELAEARPRRALVWLFVIAATLGLVLSGFIAWTSHETMRTSTPLIREQMPLLEELNDIERKLLAIQAMNQQYFAYAINRETWLAQRAELHPAFERSLVRLEAAFPREEGLRIARVVLDNFSMLEPKLDTQMQAAEIDWDEARAIVTEMSIDSRNIRGHLQALRERMAQAVLAAGADTEANIARTSRYVGTYSLVIFVIALFVAAHVRARERAEAELAWNAAHDAVTGRGNRWALTGDVAALGGRPHALAVIAVQRFHRIVGALGPEGGDSALQAIAAAVERQFAPLGGRLFRLDGARFAVLTALDEPDLALRVREGIEALAATPLAVGSHEVLLALSAGLARYPADGADVDSLLRNANLAEAEARAGRQSLIAYCAAFEQRGAHRLELESALGHAVERGELELHYQPQMAIGSGRVIGVEALVRWRREGQLVSPAEFIPVAEDTGLIVALGDWILREACRQAAAWQAAGFADLVVAINISARQFLDPGFPASVSRALAESGVRPSGIELEITESAIMHDPEAVAAELARLRALGLKLAIDDFGTGYSSLSYLRRFPLDKLKVDQSFVRPLNADSPREDRAIVEAVVRLGQTLGLTVIAEGVETEEQLALLRQLGCDEIQGYWFSRPQPAALAGAFIAGRQPSTVQPLGATALEKEKMS